jgi:hypothetical protein
MSTSDDPSPLIQWRILCREWREKHDALLSFPLFEKGWMVSDRLDECERLRAAEREVRDRMDAFIAAN